MCTALIIIVYDILTIAECNNFEALRIQTTIIIAYLGYTDILILYYGGE